MGYIYHVTFPGVTKEFEVGARDMYELMSLIVWRLIDGNAIIIDPGQFNDSERYDLIRFLKRVISRVCLTLEEAFAEFQKIDFPITTEPDLETWKNELLQRNQGAIIAMPGMLVVEEKK